MTTASPAAALATIQPVFTNAERLALAGFLAGYRGLTREAYALDLRQFTTWCRARSLALFEIRRADIESFARDLEARGRARATVTRRLCTIAGFYRYAVEEELLDHSPAAHVRRPRVHLGLERGHRTLTITRKGGKVVTIPLAPRTARAIDLAIGERTDGPVFITADGRRLDRHGAGRARPQDHPPRGNRQASHAPHAETRVHHRRAGCRGPATRRAGGSLARRPAHYDGV